MISISNPVFCYQMMKVNCDTAQEYYIQQTVKDKLLGYSFTHPKCTGSVLVELTMELRQIKEEFICAGGRFHHGEPDDYDRARRN